MPWLTYSFSAFIGLDHVCLPLRTPRAVQLIIRRTFFVMFGKSQYRVNITPPWRGCKPQRSPPPTIKFVAAHFTVSDKPTIQHQERCTPYSLLNGLSLLTAYSCPHRLYRVLEVRNKKSCFCRMNDREQSIIIVLASISLLIFSV